MLRHIVLFTCKDSKDREAIRKGLSVLTEIPHAQRLEIAFNEKLDQIGDHIDVVVYGEFADAEALHAYKAHPLYQASIEAVRPLRDGRHAVDYTVENAVITPLES